MNRLSACSITPSLEAQSGSPASQVDTGSGIVHARSPLPPSIDRCHGCGAPFDVEAPIPIGAALMELGDLCPVCIREEMDAFAGNDRS